MSNGIKIIVSDTHIGAGRQEDGNLLEDFISDQEFAKFLSDLVQESGASGRPVELIINGDFVEMLQVPATPDFAPQRRYRTEYYADSTEEGAASKIRHVVEGHPEIFTALANFISAGPFRRWVTITKGNHDPEQFWPAWQSVVRSALGATGTAADLLAFEPVAINREGIYVEHGNQYLGALDRFDNFETPLEPDHPNRVAHPLGSHFGVRTVNEMERERFWVDSIYPATAMAWYLLRWDFIFAARALATFLAAGIEILGDRIFDRGPEGEDAQDLLQSLEDPERVQQLAVQYETDAAFRSAFHQRVQDALETVEASDPMMLEPVRGGEPPAANEIATEILDKSAARLREVAAGKARESGARVVSFGHTHIPEEVALPDGAIYINTGTWIWRGDFSQADEETWRDLMDHPERYARERTLHYARIDYDDEGNPRGRLMLYEPG